MRDAASESLAASLVREAASESRAASLIHCQDVSDCQAVPKYGMQGTAQRRKSVADISRICEEEVVILARAESLSAENLDSSLELLFFRNNRFSPVKECIQRRHEAADNEGMKHSWLLDAVRDVAVAQRTANAVRVEHPAAVNLRHALNLFYPADMHTETVNLHKNGEDGVVSPRPQTLAIFCPEFTVQGDEQLHKDAQGLLSMFQVCCQVSQRYQIHSDFQAVLKQHSSEFLKNTHSSTSATTITIPLLTTPIHQAKGTTTSYSQKANSQMCDLHSRQPKGFVTQGQQIIIFHTQRLFPRS